jgi:phytoene synthase
MDASQAITRRSASSLAFAFVVLGKPRRLAMNALYAFCREVDDVADGETIPIAERRAALAEWRADIQRACEGGKPKKTVIRELQPVIEKYELKLEHFNELLLGIESDLDQDHCETFAELDQYCYRVASIAGLLSIEIFGYRNDDCQRYAVHLGKALQLTNILRDVANDAQRGRIYLPREAIEKFGVDPEALLALKYSTAFHNLAADLAVRARDHYQKAAALLPPEDRRSMLAAECMGAVYWRLLRAMEQSKFRVMNPEPLRLSRPRKLAIFLGVWWRTVIGSRGSNYGRD